MKYMLDTNICIYAIKHKPPEVIKNFLKHDPDDMCISSITYGELMHGVEKSQAVERNRVAITLFLSSVAFRAKCKIFSRHLQKPILKTEKGRFKGL